MRTRLALVTAGYQPRTARVAVESARPHVGASATLEQVIREALRRCAPA
jgi:Holliday junction resolvasome RuvABC DNA-binding subunit